MCFNKDQPFSYIRVEHNTFQAKSLSLNFSAPSRLLNTHYSADIHHSFKYLKVYSCMPKTPTVHFHTENTNPHRQCFLNIRDRREVFSVSYGLEVKCLMSSRVIWFDTHQGLYLALGLSYCNALSFLRINTEVMMTVSCLDTFETAVMIDRHLCVLIQHHLFLDDVTREESNAPEVREHSFV